MNRRIPLPRSVAALVILGLLLAGCSSTGDNHESSGGGAGSSAFADASGGAQPHEGGAASVANAGSAVAGTPNAGAPNAGTANGGATKGGASNGGGGASGNSGSAGAGASSGGAAALSKLAPGTSWQWQLTGKLDSSFAVKVYDIDLYENDQAAVSALHAKGALVICYVSVGSYEDFRPDAADFPPEVLGKDYPGWPGEKFLDIRALDKLGPIMKKRLDSCAAKGFDGIEPDNMDVFEGGSAGTGFPLTEKDGLAYAQWLADQAHARGLSIGQKNASELASKLASVLDWALTEDCFDGNWCDAMQPYIDRGKAVLMAEYTDTGVNFGNACTWAKAHQFSAILKARDLDANVQFCP